MARFVLNRGRYSEEAKELLKVYGSIDNLLTFF